MSDMSAFESMLAAADAANTTVPRLLERVDTMLAIYDRRGNTNVPGTVSLIRDLADAVRAGSDLEAIVRDLATRDPYVDDQWCRLCGRSTGHGDSCPWHRAVEWVERNSHE